jgi:dUTP pyrophosphatase
MSSFTRQSTNAQTNTTINDDNISNDEFETSNPNENYLILMLYVDDTFEHAAHLKQKYLAAIEAHNSALVNNNYPDAGFDLFVPMELNPDEGQVNMVDLKVKTSMCILGDDGNRCIPLSYYLYPRSSMSKTPLRMANSVGIIDSGYRGTLKVPLDYIPRLMPEGENYICQKHTRLVQICSPDLKPIFVKMVEHERDLDFLDSPSERGAGGLGSTGV